MPRHHISIGIYGPARRAAISAGLRARKPEDAGGRPRWGYDENGNLNRSGRALLEARTQGATFRQLESIFSCSNPPHRDCVADMRLSRMRSGGMTRGRYHHTKMKKERLKKEHESGLHEQPTIGCELCEEGDG